VVFKPPLSWPIVLVVETSDSVVFPMLAMDRSVVMAAAGMFSPPNAAATVVAMAPGVLS
jgi:hypothetical protein